MTPPPRKYAEAPGIESSAAEISPPAEDSATVMVCFRSLSSPPAAWPSKVRSFISSPQSWSASLIHVYTQLICPCIKEHNKAERKELYKEVQPMLVIAGTIPVKAEQREEAKRLARWLETETRKEPGCLMYTFYADQTAPSLFFIFEEWD